MLFLLKQKAKPAAQYKKRKTYDLLGSLKDFNESKRLSQVEQEAPGEGIGTSLLDLAQDLGSSQILEGGNLGTYQNLGGPQNLGGVQNMAQSHNLGTSQNVGAPG